MGSPDSQWVHQVVGSPDLDTGALLSPLTLKNKLNRNVFSAEQHQ